MTPTTPQPGLRERKKRRTRQTIIDVALKLFAQKGYDKTTLIEIADAAEISPSTVFNYFTTKDAIVFALTDQIVASARERIARRLDDEPTAHTIIAWIKEDLAEIERPYT